MKHTIGKTILRISPLIAGLLVVVEIILTNQLVGGGRTVRDVDLIVDQLRDENALLEQQVASSSSLATIAVKARELGFMIPTKSQFVTIIPSELPVAIANR